MQAVGHSFAVVLQLDIMQNWIYYPDEIHTQKKNPTWLSQFALGGKTCPFQNIPIHREILQWFSWIPVFFGSRCLNINNDFHATEWHVTSTFPSLSPASPLSIVFFFHRRCLTPVGYPHGKTVKFTFLLYFFIWMFLKLLLHLLYNIYFALYLTEPQKPITKYFPGFPFLPLDPYAFQQWKCGYHLSGALRTFPIEV